MRSEPFCYEGDSPAIGPIGKAAGSVHRIGARLLHEACEALPPTIFSFSASTSSADEQSSHSPVCVGLGNFMLVTMAALVVGKAVLVANKMPLLHRYDRAPLIQPILFKAGFIG